MIWLPNFLFRQRSRGGSDTRSIHICIECFELYGIAYKYGLWENGERVTVNGANVQHKILDEIKPWNRELYGER